MSVSFAELDDRVYMELEIAGEFCEIDKIHNAVVQKHNVRTMQSRNSSINVMLGTSAEFTPTDLRYDIASLIGKSVPVQIQYKDAENNWQPVRIVNISQIPDYRNLGVLAASFESVDVASSATEPEQFIEFTFIPAGACRIRFDRDLVRTGLVDNSLLPDHVSELIVKEAQNMVIPRIKLMIDMRGRNDPIIQKMSRDIKASLSEMYAQNLLDMRPLEALWKVWAYKDRSGESNFNKLTPSSRGLYGG